MARGINRVTLVGYVGADPELMHSEQGTPICNISLATTEGWRDMNGQVQTRTEWHRVVFFKRLAEVSAQFLRKGSCAYVEGRLSTNRWTDQQGIVRYGYQSMKQLNEEIDSLVRNDIRIFKTYGPQGGKEKRNG